MERSTISIDSCYLQKINTLSKKFGMNKKNFIQEVINYIDFHKINPRERNVDLSIRLLKMQADIDEKTEKLQNLIKIYIDELDNKKLDPFIKLLSESTAALKKYINEQALVKDDLRVYGFGRR